VLLLIELLLPEDKLLRDIEIELLLPEDFEEPERLLEEFDETLDRELKLLKRIAVLLLLLVDKLDKLCGLIEL
jgi:hypothetical protein